MRRVIAGKYRGIKLDTLKDMSVRPTTDRVKESMFNLIRDRLDGAVVLDLFCGSGALGIEALSRGAEFAVFADRATDSVETARANLAKTDAEYLLVRSDFTATVDKMAREGRKFDLIFLDPPYNTGADTAAIELIASRGILADGGVIVVERAREGKPPATPKGYRITDSRDYGSSTVELVEKASACCLTGTFDPFTLGHEYLLECALNEFDVVYIAVLVNPEKVTSLSPEKRVKLITQCVRKYRRKIVTEYYEGLAIDYCKKNDIEYIVRGVRNAADLAYEREMAEWNFTHGGIKTLLIPARDADISSTAVRARLREGLSVDGLVDEEACAMLKDSFGRK